MKKVFLKLSVAALALSMVSCGNQQKSSNEKTTQKEADNGSSAAKEKAFKFNQESTKIGWTAYKTTEKIGVSGNFQEISVDGLKESSQPLEVFENASFTIPVNTVFSGNQERDMRIKKFFFGKLAETTEIKGSVKSMDAKNNKAIIELGMNEISREVPFDIVVKDNHVALEGVLDVNAFNAQAAVEALNEECKELHAGSDGISKLWPDVKIEISTVLKEVSL